MGKRITGNFDQDEVDGVEALKNDLEVEHMSEAVRIACRTGLQEMGYAAGATRDTALRKAARRFGDAFAIVAIMLFGATFLMPIGIRMFVVAPLLASVSCYGLDRALRSREPAVSAWISGILGGGQA